VTTLLVVPRSMPTARAMEVPPLIVVRLNLESLSLMLNGVGGPVNSP
jgi:hypothetical protein